MRVIGRLLCALLTLVFLISLCPLPALASEGEYSSAPSSAVSEEAGAFGDPGADSPGEAPGAAGGDPAGEPGDPDVSEGGEPGDPDITEGGEPGDPDVTEGGEPGDPDVSEGGEPGGAEDVPADGAVTFYASWFVDGADLKLTADTWLVMDQARSFSSIYGDYALTVTGGETLTVVSAGGAGISAASLDCRTDLEIRAAGDGIVVSDAVLLRRGANIDAGAGAVRAGGSVTVEGKFTASSGSADAYCVYSTGGGDIVLQGDGTRISSTANAVVSQGGGILLSGDIDIRAEGSRSVALNPRGGDLVIQGGTIYASGGSCAIYSLRGVTMEAGTLIASGGIVAADGDIAINGVVSASGVNTGTVYAISGGITVRGRLDARTTQADKYCVIASGDITLIGAADITSTANGIVSQEGGITLDGDMRISSSGGTSVAVNSRGGDVLLRAGTIEASGGSCAIYSLRGVTMEEGTLLVASGGVVAARGDLTLNGVASVEGKNTAALYAPNGSVNVSGGLTATAVQSGQAAVLAGGGAALSGELNIRARADAVRAQTGNIELSGEGTISSSDEGTTAVSADEGSIRPDGAFTLSGGARALYAGSGVVMGAYLWVTEPEGALVSDTTILTAEAYPAPSVRFAVRQLGGALSLDEPVPEVGQTLRVSARGEAADLIDSGAQPDYWWLRSDDGENWEVLSRPGDTPDSLQLLAEDVGYSIRAAVTIPGYAGALFSEIVTVRKGRNDADPAVPELFVQDGTLYISVARTEQEYLLRTEAADPTSLTEEDWAAAVVPQGAYTLALAGVQGETNYVYTRLRGTDGTEPGWKVAAASAYLPISIPVRMLVFRCEGLIQDAEGSYTPYCREGDGLKITALAIPASATGYSGIRGDAWQAVGSDGESCGSFYADSASTEPLQADQFYEDVWYLTERADENVTITASYNRGYDDILTARMSFRVEAAPVEYYPLRVCGTQVTSENRGDLGAVLAAQNPEAQASYEAGALAMSFDGDKTLTVRGDFSSFGIIVENLGVEGLVINVSGDTSLTSLAAAALSLRADTTLTGEGGLSLSGSTAAVQVTDGAALTVSGISLTGSGNRGLCGADGGESLIVNNADLDLRSVRGAVTGFDGGIVLTRCDLAEPEDGRTDGGQIIDGDGRTAVSAKIAAAGITDVTLSPNYRTARITGGYTGLYARVALILESAAGSGLYVTQARIGEDGTIPIPSLSIPGLTVQGVNVALVESLDEIPSPSPATVCSCFALF